MYKEKVTVYNEELLKDADLSTTTTGTKIIKAGGTLGGLAVNLIATTAITATKTATLELLTADKATDTFTSVISVTVPAQSFAAGDIIASVIVPQNAKLLLKAKLTGDSTTTGKADAVVEYLAR